MSTIIIGKPNEKQKLFLSAKAKYVGYGGARGGGKSWSVRTKSKLLGLRFAGIKMLIVEWYHIPVAVSLAVVFSALLLSVLVSWLHMRRLHS